MSQFWKPGTERPRLVDDEEGGILLYPTSSSSSSSGFGYGSLEKQRQRLPVYKYRTDILYLVETHATTIIVGETGSGKTTQIPQYLKEAGWAEGGRMIACTQPRRLAVQAVASRVAEEMDVKLGEEVGYTIRFEDITNEELTRVKFLTDGVLLREMMDDPLLSKYRAVIILPEIELNAGWGEIASKIERFIHKNFRFTRETEVPKLHHAFAHTLRSNKWSESIANIKVIQPEDSPIKIVGSMPTDKSLLNRCIVGKFSKELDIIPSRTEVRRWVNNKWSNAVGVYELNGLQFLFEFPTRRMAEQTMEETWRWKNATLLLRWWSPTAACYPSETKFDWIWVRILGLPLHLWSSEIMKVIGEKCGGWIETEEETQLRNHMRWARIKVKGPAEKIPRVVEVEEGGMIFSLPLWSEIPTAVKVFQEEAVVESAYEESPRTDPFILEIEANHSSLNRKTLTPHMISQIELSAETCTESPHNLACQAAIDDEEEDTINPRTGIQPACLGSNEGIEETINLQRGAQQTTIGSIPENQSQIIPYNDSEFWEIEDVTPLEIRNSIAEDEASLWVHKTVLKLSKQYGVDFKGGLNDKGKMNIIKSLIQERRADIYCFQETKLE
ncbi:putative pre-mrna-splicing factor atp-dependent rna helicase deah9, partial [Nicotiana attenuata]